MAVIARAGLRAGLALLLAYADPAALAQDGAPRPPSCDAPDVLQLMREHRFEEAVARQKALLQELDTSRRDVPTYAVSVCMRALIGALLSRLERDKEALAILVPLVQEARARMGPDRHETLQAELMLASSYGRSGQRDQQIQTLQSLRPRFAKRYGARSAHMRTLLQSLATAYHWTGNYADALPIEREALSIAEEIARAGKCATKADCVTMLARTQTSHAGTLRRLNRASEALPYAEQAAASLESVSGPNHPDTLDAHLLIASVHFTLGARERALEIEREVYARAQQHLGDDHPVTRKARGNIAVTLHNTGSTAESIDLERQQIAQLREKRGPNHPETLLALSNMAARLIETKDYDQALPMLEEALGMMLSTRAGLNFDDRLTLAYQENWRRLVDSYVGTLLVKKRQGDAFLVTEFFKARLLADRLSLDSAERGLTEEQGNALRRLKRTLGSVEQTLAMKRSLNQPTGSEEAVRAALSQKLQELQRSPASQVAFLPSAQNPPDWYRSLFLAEQQSARVSYFFLGRVLAAFVDSGSRIQAVRLGNRDAVSESVEAYRLLMRSRASGAAASQPVTVWARPAGGYTTGTKPHPDAREITDVGEIRQFLSDVLIKPLTAYLKDKSRIIVSPDQVLAHVPFDSLLLEGNRIGDIAEVVMVPSLALYDRLAQRKRDYSQIPRAAFLGFGGAPYRRVTQLAQNVLYVRERDSSLRPMDVTVIAQQIRKDPSKLLLAYAAHMTGFSELPGSLVEVNGIAGILGQSNATLFTGNLATEANLNRLADEGKLSSYRAVHFAAHGFLSDEEPGLSAIVLSQVNRAPGTDGYITVSELSTLNLKTDLVVVSACDSGVGKVNSGEGMLGISYALFQAGTVASLVTLWPIPDKETARFMIRFYEEWNTGASPATALAVTKRWALKAGVSHYAVDAFVLFGV